MSSLFDKIKADFLAARKQRAASVSLLSTLVGDLQKIEKDTGSVTDEKVISLLKKYRDNLSDCIAAAATLTPAARESMNMELALIAAYLPRQLTEAEIEVNVRALVANGATTIGAIMSGLKSTVPGLYDGQSANKIARAVLEEILQ